MDRSGSVGRILPPIGQLGADRISVRFAMLSSRVDRTPCQIISVLYSGCRVIESPADRLLIRRTTFGCWQEAVWVNLTPDPDAH